MSKYTPRHAGQFSFKPNAPKSINPFTLLFFLTALGVIGYGLLYNISFQAETMFLFPFFIITRFFAHFTK